MRIFVVTLIIIVGALSLSNCSGDNTKGKTSKFTMREDSELTLLMRDMYTYFDSLKISLENGEKLPAHVKDFAEIHASNSTEPSKAESPLFKAMATVYLESAQRLNASRENIPAAFNDMVDNCMNCHKQMCPGPMVRIKKLYVDVK